MFSKALLRLLDKLVSEFLKAVDINEDSSQNQQAPFMVDQSRCTEDHALYESK